MSGLLLVASLKAPNARAGDPPDEINVAKYLKIYQDAKAVSDVKRGRANELLSEARAIDAQVTALQRQISGTQSSIRAKKEQLARLQRENPELTALNDALSLEINRHQSEVNGNILLIQQVTQDLRNTEGQLRQERARLDSLQQRLSQVTSELASVQSQVQTREGELGRASLELRQAIDRRSEGQRRYEFVNSELQRMRFEINQRQLELQQTQAQTPALRSRVDQIQAVYNQRQSAAAPLQ
ncbi:MAG TPA: hypothetical protein VM598_12920, partial [Bdellovibrionota bacterium]|nr:hypothetical protein [Bdellovibrionota bacterium]